MFTQHAQNLYAWANRTIKRFPKSVDSRLIRGLYTILGPEVSSSFLKKRSLFHLKRLLVTQFLLQKKMEQHCIQKKNQLLVRIFSIDGTLCIVTGYPKKESKITGQIILEVASQKVPALQKVDRSFYQWESQEFSYAFCYVELEKMRGKDLSSFEAKNLATHLSANLCYYLSETSIFWPYNHEEAFKQLLILAKEISSKKDYPQVSIRFQKQIPTQLEFIIYLARPKATVSLETAITDSHFPLSTQLIPHIKQEVNFRGSCKIPFRVKFALLSLKTTFCKLPILSRICQFTKSSSQAKIIKFPFESDFCKSLFSTPILIEAFSLLIPSKGYEHRPAVNLLHAREFIAKLLKDVIGIFRDYNGGLFETQKARFEKLCTLFSEAIPNFFVFAEDLFYALCPIETQITLSDFLFKTLFDGFSKALNKPSPFIGQVNRYLLIFKENDGNAFHSFSSQAKKLQEAGEITAYANIKIFNKNYFCVFNETGKFLSKTRHCFSKPSSSRIFYLAFQDRRISSLNPGYLSSLGHTKPIGSLLFESLTRIDPSGNVTYAGAEKAYQEQGSYFFKIRENYWSNGDRVTAFDYERGWKKVFFSSSQKSYFHFLTHSKRHLGVKALDASTLQLHLSQHDPFILEKLSHPILSPIYCNTTEPTIFNGPYAIQQEGKDFLIFEKNPYYWDKKNIFFEKVELTFGLSSKKTWSLYKQGKTHWLGLPFNSARLNPCLQKTHQIFRPCFLYFNTKNFFFSSRFTRKVFSSAIDRCFVTTEILPGYQPLFRLLPADLFSSDQLPCNSEKLLETFSAQLPRTSHQAPENFEPPSLGSPTSEKWELTPGQAITLSCSDHQGHIKVAKYLKKRWEEVFSIKVILDIKEWNLFIQKLEKGNFQVALMLRSLFSKDPYLFFEEFASAENYSLWSHPDYSKLLAQIKDARSLSEKEKYWLLAEEFLIDHCPIAPIVNYKHFYSPHPKLKNYVLDSNASVDFRFSSLS
ncbi:MAG: ABC transporter substrate-binding protein [Chlamydiota bacterium]